MAIAPAPSQAVSNVAPEPAKKAPSPPQAHLIVPMKSSKAEDRPKNAARDQNQLDAAAGGLKPVPKWSEHDRLANKGQTSDEKSRLNPTIRRPRKHPNAPGPKPGSPKGSMATPTGPAEVAMSTQAKKLVLDSIGKPRF